MAAHSAPHPLSQSEHALAHRGKRKGEVNCQKPPVVNLHPAVGSVGGLVRGTSSARFANREFVAIEPEGIEPDEPLGCRAEHRFDGDAIPSEPARVRLRAKPPPLFATIHTLVLSATRATLTANVWNYWRDDHARLDDVFGDAAQQGVAAGLVGRYAPSGARS